MARDPGELLLGVQVGNDTVAVHVYYRREGVLLCDSTRSQTTRVMYEGTYDYHDVDIRRASEGVRFQASSVARLAALGLEEGLGRGPAAQRGNAVGSIGSALYLAEQARGDRVRAREALLAVAGGNDTLAVGYVPRLQLEQFIRGRWTPLTRYGDGMESVCLAPEETIRLRVRVRALKALYLRERVTIAAMPDPEEAGLVAAIGRPSLSRADWVRPWGPTYIGVGDGSVQEWEFARKHFFTHFAFPVTIRPRHAAVRPVDVLVAEMGTRVMVVGPYVGDWDGPPCNKRPSAWPVVPTPATVAVGVSHEGEFPGAGIYPAWAARRLMSWGIYYWEPKVGSPEYRTYGPVREYLLGMVRWHQFIRERNGQAAADGFWQEVMDFSGGDSLKAVNWLEEPNNAELPGGPADTDDGSRDRRGSDREPGESQQPRKRRSDCP